MQKIIIFSVVLACASALRAYLVENHELHYPVVKSTITHSNQLVDHGSTYVHAPVVPVVHELSSAKSTLTKSSQVVNHGSTAVLHAPVYQAMYSQIVPSKTTVTKSNHVVNHGGTTLVHAPVVPVVHSSVCYPSSVVSLKSGDSATSHHSSTVHETVPVVNHLPLYALH